jgi:hypothetical protein
MPVGLFSFSLEGKEGSSGDTTGFTPVGPLALAWKAGRKIWRYHRLHAGRSFSFNLRDVSEIPPTSDLEMKERPFLG